MAGRAETPACCSLSIQALRASLMREMDSRRDGFRLEEARIALVTVLQPVDMSGVSRSQGKEAKASS